MSYLTTYKRAISLKILEDYHRPPYQIMVQYSGCQEQPLCLCIKTIICASVNVQVSLYASYNPEILDTYVFVVLSDTQENADRAAKMVTVQYSSQTKPLLTIADAIKANSIYPYPGEANILNVGDANGVFI